MLRFVKDDWERLQSYLSEYRIGGEIESGEGADLVKRMHKATLASFQLLAKLEGLASTGELYLCGINIDNCGLPFLFITETFSDIASTLFLSLHGLYKPAQASVRSSIEVFVRGGAALTASEALGTKNVYELFEVASAQAIFSGSSQGAFAKLRELYSSLCLFVHSASPAHMARSFALANYPRVDLAKMRRSFVVLRLWLNALLRFWSWQIGIFIFKFPIARRICSTRLCRARLD